MSHTDLIDAALDLGGGGIDMVLIYYEAILLICWHNCYLSYVRTCTMHLNVTIMYFNISLLLVVAIFVLLVFIGQA